MTPIASPRPRPEPVRLDFPHAEPPVVGRPMEVAPGILWLRLALPYALDHVNLYLFEDADGWTLFDTGLGDDRTRAAWDELCGSLLKGRPITRLIVSHAHPDHVGMAGWLHERFAPPLLMPRSEYLLSQLLQRQRTPAVEAGEAAHYRACGVGEEDVGHLLKRGLNYLTRTTGLAHSYQRLASGDRLSIGGRDWRVITGGGHSLEQAMLWCEADRIFLSADQVLARISPNVSVYSMEPQADPLGGYLDSLAELGGIVGEDALVLPGHNLPFRGLPRRTAELTEHHAQRCERLAIACRDEPRTCAELVPVLFPRRLDPHQLGFAIGEALAHLNHMVSTGALAVGEGGDGVLRYRTL